VAVSAAADEPAEEGPPSIAVLRFENPLANPWWSVDGIRRAQDLLVGEIQASGRFAVLDRAALDARMQEEKLLMPAGQLSPAAAVKLGRVLGMDYLVTGSLSEYGAGSKAGRRRLLGLRAGRDFAAELSLRVVDGASGELVWADGARHAAASSGEWANADPAAVDAAMFEPLLVPLLRDLVGRMLATELEAAEPEPID
jgi:curli biogenesis system outer membrane secretion channel CsgG